MIAVSAPHSARPASRVVGNARRHQQAADIGVAETERAVFVGQFARSPSTGTAPSAPRFRARRSTAAPRARRPRRRTALVCSSRKVSRLSEARLHAVSSRNMYSEHGLEARIVARCRAGVPVVDRGVELQAGIGGGPGGVADLFPQVARLQRSWRPCRSGAPIRSQSPSVSTALQELVGDAHRVVGVLAGDGEIGLRVPIGVVDREIDVGVALLGELDHALDDSCPAHSALRASLISRRKRRVLLRRRSSRRPSPRNSRRPSGPRSDASG